MARPPATVLADAPVQPSVRSAALADTISWPEGTLHLKALNLDGLLLVQGTIRPWEGRDTTGWFALDTGAGYLALDWRLADYAGIASGPGREPVAITTRPLQRLTLAGQAIDQVSPVITFDARIVRQVADRPVLGLLGHELYADRALVIDYAGGTVALVPAGLGSSHPDSVAIASSRQLLAGVLGPDARGIRFELADDGKALVRVRITPPGSSAALEPLTLILDTGASKTALFENAPGIPRGLEKWKPAIRGLLAPTLLGEAAARLARAERVEVGGVGAEDVAVALISSPLAGALERAVGRPVHGLLGYSYLRRFRVVCDYAHEVLWLEPPRATMERRFEYCHFGLQLERRSGEVTVTAVAAGSPAARARIRPGDVLRRLGSNDLGPMGIPEIELLMEGRPGTREVLEIRRGTKDRQVRLRRRCLL